MLASILRVQSVYISFMNAISAYCYYYYYYIGMGEGRGVHRVLVGKPEGKRPLGRPRRRWEDNIKEVGGSCGDWMELAQDRDRWRALVGTVRNIRVPKRRGIS